MLQLLWLQQAPTAGGGQAAACQWGPWNPRQGHLLTVLATELGCGSPALPLQDSAGMVTTTWEKFYEYKANGLVKDVFNSQSVLDKLKGGRHSLGLAAGRVQQPRATACTCSRGRYGDRAWLAAAPGAALWAPTSCRF